MKRLPIYILAFHLVLLTGCDNYLEENPDNRVELNTTEKAAQLLTNAYSNAAYTFTEWMGDNVSFTLGTVILPEHEQAYRWKKITNDNQDTPVNFWNATYDAIAHANEVLAVIDKLPGSRLEKNAVKGEAYLTRAYGHFMLVNLFAKHYSKNTAEQDLGIPYVTEPETEFIKKYKRGTVEDVYDNIEDDLLEGLDLVDGSYYANSGKYHFTRDAALAFASRFYLFKGEHAKCVQYSTEMLGGDPDVFIKNMINIVETAAGFDDFIRAYTSPTDQSNLLMIRNVTNYPVNVGYWPSANLLDNIYNSKANPWGSIDIRSRSEYKYVLERGNNLSLAKYEFLFERSSLTSNVGLYYTIMPAFRGEEVLLNRAEAYLYLNEITKALSDIKVIINKRYAGNITPTAQQFVTHYQIQDARSAILNYLVDERRKEFMHEGLRWFDLKRYNIPVSHADPEGTYALQPNDNRKIIQIPQAAIDIGGLEPNPR